MKKPPAKKVEKIPDRLIQSICARLAEDKPVRRTLPGWGRIHIDRRLPFLCVYRRPVRGSDEGTARLLTSEASYLLAPSDRGVQASLGKLVTAVARMMSEQFGAFLLLEIWAGKPKPSDAGDPLTPHFRIVAPRKTGSTGFTETFAESLRKVSIAKRTAVVEVSRSKKRSPRSLGPIVPEPGTESTPWDLFGLEIEPVYRDSDSGEVYPLLMRELEHSLTRALRQTFYQYARTRTRHVPKHFHMLGRRAVVKAVWEIDRRLAAVADSFDFLLYVTPVNTPQAWREFQTRRLERAPTFRYRPLPVDPVTLKRKLFQVRVDRIEDPTLARLFYEKLVELDRQITLLLDRNTPRFVHGSIQLYGGVEEELLQLAEDVLRRAKAFSKDGGHRGSIGAEAFRQRAQEELDFFRNQWTGVNSRVELRRDIPSGLMVSRGALLIGSESEIPMARVEALIQHEVGTHVLTYCNGRAQPFRQLYSGLAGYEGLQEGLAVLAEYLVGGLSRSRLRLLAARVIACHRLVQGLPFVETFRELHRTYGFTQRTAYNITMRVYRAGGLTKDAIYLRGLSQILKYVGSGGELEDLFVGKIGVAHIPIMRELRWRRVLSEPPLTPRYMSQPEARSRLEEISNGMTVLDLIERSGK